MTGAWPCRDDTCSASISFELVQRREEEGERGEESEEREEREESEEREEDRRGITSLTQKICGGHALWMCSDKC